MNKAQELIHRLAIDDLIVKARIYTDPVMFVLKDGSQLYIDRKDYESGYVTFSDAALIKAEPMVIGRLELKGPAVSSKRKQEKSFLDKADISVRAYQICKSNELYSLEDIAKLTLSEFSNLSNNTIRITIEVHNLLKANGLNFKNES